MIRVGFALLSNSHNPIPSTRIACLNMFQYLRKAGFEPEILFDPLTPCEEPELDGVVDKALARQCAVVVFQKVHGSAVVEAATRLRNAGVRTVYSVCDLVDNQMAAATDATIAVTSYLKSLYHPDLQARIRVVHDGVERPELFRSTKDQDVSKRGRGLKASLVTSHELYAIPVLGIPPRGWCVDVIGHFPPGGHRMTRMWSARRMLSATGLTRKVSLLLAMLHSRIRHIAWDYQGVYERLLESDAGIIPINTSDDHCGPSGIPSWKVKSENRLTLKMAMGLPVIATPIPSYEDIIEHGKNGFLARSRRDWLYCLERLRDEDLRREMGSKARESALGRYSMDAQANLLLAVLGRVMIAETNYDNALAPALDR